VRCEDAEAYAAYIDETGMKEYAATPGNRGAWMLTRQVEELTEFVMFSLWDSFDAIKGFAGEDYATAVFYPEDDRYLVERDPTCTHWEVTRSGGG
jgi:heme-degrading monooxygenase HmoA